MSRTSGGGSETESGNKNADDHNVIVTLTRNPRAARLSLSACDKAPYPATRVGHVSNPSGVVLASSPPSPATEGRHCGQVASPD